MTDDRFERELRAALAKRAPTGASPALQARVLTVPQTVSPRGSWLPRLGRDLFGVAATVVAAVGLMALLSTSSMVRPSPPDGAGASVAPGVAPAPYVTAPDEFFTAPAIADAERRLRAVAASYGVEASLIVHSAVDSTQLSPPVGWPEAFDRDGDPDRDIVIVFGLTPDDRVVCCLTVLGNIAASARDTMAWPPQNRPTRLESDLEMATAPFRDVALDRFVVGIERFAPAIAATSTGPSGTSLWRFVVIGSIVLPILALFIVGRRRTTVVAAGHTSGASPAIATDLPLVVGPADSAPVTWAPPPDDTADLALIASDRRLPWLAAALLGIWIVIVAVPLLLPSPAGLPLDAANDGQGIARPARPYLALSLVGGALVVVAIDAARGGWRRRLATASMVVLVAAVVVPNVAGARPDLDGVDRPWAVWPPTSIVERGSFSAFITLPVGPGDPFALAFEVQNPGILPITILGLDGPTTPDVNGVPGSLVSLGSIPDPATVRGDVILSARPEDATVAWPLTIPPGGRATLVVVGRGGPCARPDGAGGSSPITRVPIAYRVLGIERTADVGLPAVLFIPTESGCTAPFPGGWITY